MASLSSASVRSFAVAAMTLVLMNSPVFPQSEEMARDFILKGVDGRTAFIQPGRLQKVLLVYIFTVNEIGWGEDMLALQGFYKENRRRGVAAVAVAARAPGVDETVRQFAWSNKIQLPVGVDSKNGAMDAFTAAQMPKVVLIDARGNVRLRSQETLSVLLPKIRGLLPGLLKDRNRFLKEQKKLLRKQEKERRKEEKYLARTKSITPEELKEMLDSGEEFSLYFIGTHEAFEEKHIPKATLIENVPDDFLEGHDHKAKIVFYCGCKSDAWGVSGRVATKLRLRGFDDVSYLDGHMQAWADKEYPLVSGVESTGGINE